MNTLKLELENCYGIQKMQQDIDFSKNNVEIPYEYNSEELEKQIDTLNGQIPGGVVESSYDIDEENAELVISKGKAGLEVDPEILKQEVENEIKNVENTEKEIKLSNKDIENYE